MRAPEPTPWRDWLNSAAYLGVSPAAFWRLSLREWRALMGATPNSSLSRTEFDKLANAHPD